MTEKDENRTDAAWWCDGSGWAYVTTVVEGGRTINVYCSGQMRISNDETGATIRTASDLADHGFTEDMDLIRVDHERGPWRWVNNPWFELSEDDQEIGLVSHTIQDAIEQARDYAKGEAA
jgi:hypothetical protein